MFRYFIIALLSMTFLFSGCSKSPSEETLQAEATKLKQLYFKKIDEKIEANVGYAIQFSQNKKIVSSVLKGDYKSAGAEMDRLVSDAKSTSQYKSLRLHAHTANIQSFIRQWQGGQKQDSLASFRHSIKYANKQDDVIVGFEVGRAGLLLRAVAPIQSDCEIIGSIESIQGVESIVDDLKPDREILIFFMNKNRLYIATDLMQSPGLKELVVAQQEYDSELLKALEDVDLHSLYTMKYITHKDYLMTGIEVFDISGVNSGLVVLAKKLKDIK